MDDPIPQRDLTMIVQPTEELQAMLRRFRELRRTALHLGADASVVAQWDELVRTVELELQFRADENEVPF